MKTKDVVSKAPEGHVSKSLITQGLTPEQWGKLDQINEALTEEYSLRRRMLLTRCNVTVKSFKWSDKAKVIKIHTHLFGLLLKLLFYT